MPTAKTAAPAPRKHVLLIEDNRLIRAILCELLESEGFAVHVAGHGGEGLAALASGQDFALILLDWVMPVVSGSEFRRHQLALPRWAHTPTLVLTADVQQASKEAKNVGATLVEKPIDLGSFVQLVRSLC